MSAWEESVSIGAGAELLKRTRGAVNDQGYMSVAL